MKNTVTQQLQILAQALWKKSLYIVLPAITLSAITVAVLLLFVPREFSSQMKVLVVQKYTLTDSYTAAKSAEKVSQNLAEVVHTSTFFSQVVESKQVDLSELLVLPEEEKRKAWEKKVVASVGRGTSIMEIVAYDTDPVQAQRLIETAVGALLDHGANYHGAPDTIELRVVDTALTSKHPVRPNVVAYGMAAALLGLIAGVAWVVFTTDIQSGPPTRKQEVAALLAEPVEEVESVEAVDVDAELDSDPEPESVHTYTVLDVQNYHHQVRTPHPHVRGGTVVHAPSQFGEQ